MVWDISYFPIYCGCHHPNWRTPSIFRGVVQPPTRKPCKSRGFPIAMFDHVCQVLIIDDFTNSGSTLFGAVSLVRRWAVRASFGSKNVLGSRAMESPEKNNSIKQLWCLMVYPKKNNLRVGFDATPGIKWFTCPTRSLPCQFVQILRQP